MRLMIRSTASAIRPASLGKRKLSAVSLLVTAVSVASVIHGVLITALLPWLPDGRVRKATAVPCADPAEGANKRGRSTEDAWRIGRAGCFPPHNGMAPSMHDP